MTAEAEANSCALCSLPSSAPQIHHLSSMVELKPGDLIFMGTPHGWGPLVPGDEVEGGLQGADGGLSVTVKFRMEAKK